MNVIIDLILIQIICVNIVDISGVVSHIENAIARALKLKSVSIHLIECSFCVSHWCCVIYLLFNGALSLKTYSLNDETKTNLTKVSHPQTVGLK